MIILQGFRAGGLMLTGGYASGDTPIDMGPPSFMSRLMGIGIRLGIG